MEKSIKKNSFIDSHFHLFSLINEKNITAVEIENELIENNVLNVVNIISSENEMNQLQTITLNENINYMQIAGIHPHEADTAISENISLDWIKENRDNILAIGECGLDYYYDFSSKENQITLFKKMVELAIEMKKPLVIHGREAEEEIIEIIESYNEPLLKILFHCYTGSLETALKIIKKGWYISFSGILTFKKSEELKKILTSIPINQILFETDSPYLAPIPFRGKTNTPGKVKYVYNSASNLLEIDIDELQNIIINNFKEFFLV